MSVIFHENPGTSLGSVVTDTNTSLDRSIETSPEWIDDLFPNVSFIDSPTHQVIRGFCRDVFVYRLPGGFRLVYLLGYFSLQLRSTNAAVIRGPLACCIRGAQVLHESCTVAASVLPACCMRSLLLVSHQYN
ncbi:hypothetical protein CRE_21653 [Caenorhabditis remanei]|uniref:Uncharacterized protein n=1 Tax=Caenorhabditis remanei TaxID=31234 RepID=E3NQ67_CAERE|nr:hypothetical protein CRE_21653 [Caenorhabditis remanei]